MWSRAEKWLQSLEATLDTPEGEEIRRTWKVKVAAATLLDVAAVDARAADSRTGRDVATSHQTVAGILGCSSKTVQRARELIEALGYARTIACGRYLTSPERAAAYAHHGTRQIRMASERALITPRSSSNVHLPRRGPISSTCHVGSGLPKRAQSRAAPTQRPKSAPRRPPPRPSLAVQRLAAALAQRVPWLARGHIGSLCHTLTRLGVDDTAWSAHDILELLDRRNQTLGLYAMPGADPLALFAHQLRDALADVDEPPAITRARRTAAAAAERRTHAAAVAARAEQLAAEQRDPTCQTRVQLLKDQIRHALKK